MSTLVSDLINQAFVDLAVIQPGDAVSSTLQTDAFARLNQLLASLSTEGLTVFTEVVGSFAATAGQTAYTLGVGGTWSTASRAQKIVGWKITGGVYTSGGAPVSFADFDAAAQSAALNFQAVAAQLAADEQALVSKVQAAMAPFFQTPTFTFPAIMLTNANVPMVLGADTAWPLINVRVFPAPVANGIAEIAYWTPITAFATAGDTVNLPPGYESMLHWALAVELFPQYARPGQTIEVVAANAQNRKASIVDQNTIKAPQAQANQ